jgi:hypothetical protein
MPVAGPLPFPTITGVWEWRIGGEGEERKEYQHFLAIYAQPSHRPITGRGFQIVLSRSSVEEAFLFISALEVFANRYQNPKRRNEGEGFFCETSKQNIPCPVIDLLSRVITEPGGSFLLVLGPAFSALLTNAVSRF